MTFIPWAGPRYVQELTTIVGPQNRTQGSCDYLQSKLPDALSLPAVFGPGTTPVLSAFAASAGTVEVSSAHIGTLSPGVNVAFAHIVWSWALAARGNSIYVEDCNDLNRQK